MTQGYTKNTLSNTPTGASGTVLQGAGAGNVPVYSTATYPSTATGAGTILRADGTNWSASTATYPNTATGTNKVLVADGTNWVASTPTFPNASATTRKIIVSDGTNWVASTETYAVPGTSGNVMTSDGTNWTSAAASGSLSGLTYVTLNITSAQIKSLVGNPIQVVAAPSAGKQLCVVGPIYGKFNYGGSDVFTAPDGETIILAYGTDTNFMSTVCINSVITGALSVSTCSIGNSWAALPTNREAKALNLWNPSGIDIGGNASNNNTYTVAFLYFTVTLT